MSQTLESAIENRELINQILKQFAKIISNLANKTESCGLLSGLTGDLLFLYQFSQYEASLAKGFSPAEASLVDEAIFNNKLEFLQQQLATSVSRPDLSSGLSGQGWFLEYLNQGQGSDYDPELCEEIDSILHNTLSTDTWSGEIEMVLGLSGIAIYAGRRQLQSGSAELFDKLIGHFESIAIQTGDNTLAWPQPDNSVYRFNKDDLERPEFNLGLAHGVPGIIAAILPALKIPALYERTKSLLVQSCDWLLDQELDDPQSISCFASSCNDNHGSRLGWCYGDLTIALTLARVGRALEHPSYIDKAKQISLHAARRDNKQGMIRDAGLCHGSAGLALIFQLLNREINETELLQAANKWLLYTLDLYREKSLKGLYMYSGLSKEYEEDTGLLMGFGGIGLCLLAALEGDTDWVDCLLMA